MYKSMKALSRIFSAFALLLLLSQCTVPPPGSVVFDGENDPEKVVNEYHGVKEENLEGYEVIEIETQSIGNPADTAVGYIPARHQPADFD
jgi:hypothetical protein